MHIQENLQHIHKRIKIACEKVNREYSSVKLLAVSKTKSVDDINEAYQYGQRAFGENYIQEGIEKIQYFNQKNMPIEWHLIGPVQSNKTRLVAEYFDWMQTLDREKIAFRLNEHRLLHQKSLNVLIQINISNEKSKSGIQPCEMMDFAHYICNLPKLKLRGLMAIPEPLSTENDIEKDFIKMKDLFIHLQNQFTEQQIDTLSLGMSDDMELAVKHGSTMVRIGTSIFGARNYPK